MLRRFCVTWWPAVPRKLVAPSPAAGCLLWCAAAADQICGHCALLLCPCSASEVCSTSERLRCLRAQGAGPGPRGVGPRLTHGVVSDALVQRARRCHTRHTEQRMRALWADIGTGCMQRAGSIAPPIMFRGENSTGGLLATYVRVAHCDQPPRPQCCLTRNSPTMRTSSPGRRVHESAL